MRQNAFARIHPCEDEKEQEQGRKKIEEIEIVLVMVREVVN